MYIIRTVSSILCERSGTGGRGIGPIATFGMLWLTRDFVGRGMGKAVDGSCLQQFIRPHLTRKSRRNLYDARCL